MKKFPYLDIKNIPEGTTHVFVGRNRSFNHPPTPNQFEKISNLKIQEWEPDEEEFIDHAEVDDDGVVFEFRVSLQYYLENMEKSNEDFEMKKSNLESGMVVGVSRTSLKNYTNLEYGVIISNGNNLSICYFDNKNIPGFDNINSLNDDLTFRVNNHHGICEVYAHTDEKNRQIPLNFQQLEWCVNYGFYQKIWDRKENERVVPNGTKLVDVSKNRELLVSIEKGCFLEHVSIIDIESGERIINDFKIEKDGLTMKRLTSLLNNLNLFFYLKG